MARPLPPDLRATIDETSGLDLADQDLHAYSFDELHIRGTRFTHTDLTEASFRSANIDSTHFYHTSLTRSHFDAARIHKTEFYHAALATASFLDAKISRTNFVYADLSQADFSHASLLDVWFRAAPLRNTSLRNAVLKGVQFSAVDLAGLDVTGARFDDVWFEEVTGLEGMRAEWILIGDELFHERLEGEQARDWLQEAAHFATNAYVRWSNAGQYWRREPELVPSGQRQLSALLESGTDAPFAGIQLTRAAVEWLIARHLSSQETLDLRGADLRRVVLEGLPLQGLVGSMTPEQWATATPAERERYAANCQAASFQGAHLEDALLVGVNCAETYLSGHLDRADFSYARLLNAKMQLASAQDACFDHTSAHGLDASHGDFRGSTWRNASLLGARFDYAKLEGADFTGADLRDATFTGASIEGALFPEGVH